MKYRLAAVALAGIALVGCSNLPTFFAKAGTEIQTIIDKFKADVAAFDAGVSGVVAKLNSSVAASGQDLKMVCGGISVLNGLYQAVAPLAGATSADNANEGIAMAGGNALCAGPAPTDVATAVATGLGTYKTIKSAVEAKAPGATAVAAAPAR